MELPKVGDLTVLNAVIFDGSSAELVEGSIRIADGVIVEVGDRVSHADHVVDAGGRTVLPGLIDAHFHAYGLTLDGYYNDTVPLSFAALQGANRLKAALGRGFTTIRDVAGGDIGLAQAISKGFFDSPRYFFTGPALSQTGGHGDPRSAGQSMKFHAGHSNEIVDGVDDLRRAVRNRFRQGSHAIKMMLSGGVISPVDPIRVPQYSADEVQAVTQETARRGSYVAAHAYSSEAIQHAVLNGVRSIEHGNLLDRDTAGLMAAHNSYLVPTLIAYDAMDRRGIEVGLSPIAQQKNSYVLDSGKTAIEFAHAAGVRVGFGSDLLGDLASEQLLGLRLQSEVSGMLNTLRSATSVNASLLQMEDLGHIGVGGVGDLLILDGNPFEDPACLWDAARPRAVVRGGVLISGGIG
jgi:imidazolonepropionase-like amidohydrolase